MQIRQAVYLLRWVEIIAHSLHSHSFSQYYLLHIALSKFKVKQPLYKTRPHHGAVFGAMWPLPYKGSGYVYCLLRFLRLPDWAVLSSSRRSQPAPCFPTLSSWSVQYVVLANEVVWSAVFNNVFCVNAKRRKTSTKRKGILSKRDDAKIAKILYSSSGSKLILLENLP